MNKIIVIVKETIEKKKQKPNIRFINSWINNEFKANTIIRSIDQCCEMKNNFILYKKK